MNLPEWAKKPLDDMTEADKEAWDAWEPSEEEALAASQAIGERVRSNHALSITEVEFNAKEQ